VFEILLSHTAEHPLYIQIYTQIRNHIRSGVIRHGTRLPSTRSLQQQLNISKTPIEMAFQMLSSEGFIVSKPRSGLYVADPYQHEAPVQTSEDLRQQQVSIPPLFPSNPSIQIDFNPVGVDNEAFPLRMWRKTLNESIENHSIYIHKYGNPQGEYALRAVLAEYLKTSRGVSCSPEQVVIGSGFAYCMGLITQLLKGIGRIAYEEPGYDQGRELFLLNGFHVVPIPVGEYGISLESLKASGAGAVYVTPSHQLPTGGSMPYTKRENLLDWANSNGAYIIEDDYDGEFRYIGKPLPSLQSLDRLGRVIYMGTFSKVFTPAIRMNYMVLPLELTLRLGELLHMLNAPSRLEQWAMTAWIEQGHWYRHIRRMRNTYRKKRQRMLELITAHFANHVNIIGDSAGLHIRMELKTRVSADELIKRAAMFGVKVYDLRNAWMNWVEPEFPVIYLGFAGMRETDMEEGIVRLQTAWANVWS